MICCGGYPVISKPIVADFYAEQSGGTDLVDSMRRVDAVAGQFAVFGPGESGFDSVFAFGDPPKSVRGASAHLHRDGDMVQAVVETGPSCQQVRPSWRQPVLFKSGGRISPCAPCASVALAPDRDASVAAAGSEPTSS